MIYQPHIHSCIHHHQQHLKALSTYLLLLQLYFQIQLYITHRELKFQPFNRLRQKYSGFRPNIVISIKKICDDKFTSRVPPSLFIQICSGQIKLCHPTIKLISKQYLPCMTQFNRLFLSQRQQSYAFIDIYLLSLFFFYNEHTPNPVCRSRKNHTDIIIAQRCENQFMHLMNEL